MREQGPHGGTEPGGPDMPGPGRRPRPWFGPKRLGVGYRPQTWQGWAVLAVLVAALVIAGTIAPGTPWFWAVLVLVVLIPLAIISLQNR